MSKIINKSWYTDGVTGKPIGIIIVDNDFEQKAYIGTGLGNDEYEDLIRIANRGGKFPLSTALQMNMERCNYEIDSGFSLVP